MPSDYDEGCSYPITLKLIEDGNNHLVLADETLDITCPVRLIHGMVDTDVPYHLSIQLAHKLTSDNVQVMLVKTGDHRMSDDKTLQLIGSQLISIAGEL